MNNFIFNTPTKIFFGKDQINYLPEQILKKGNRVLLAYGGGSIKKIGLYEKIITLFNENNIEYFELN